MQQIVAATATSVWRRKDLRDDQSIARRSFGRTGQACRRPVLASIDRVCLRLSSRLRTTPAAKPKSTSAQSRGATWCVKGGVYRRVTACCLRRQPFVVHDERRIELVGCWRVRFARVVCAPSRWLRISSEGERRHLRLRGDQLMHGPRGQRKTLGEDPDRTRTDREQRLLAKRATARIEQVWSSD